MSGRQVRWLLAVAVIVLLGGADSALAWGPATHIYLAGQLLGQAGLLSAGLAALLLRHSRHFLYGNIAADVVLGKRLSRVKHSCHKWEMGERLLRAAETPDQEAFAYGYLSHLAADVVAHNKYLPRQLLVSRTTLNLGHLFWEIRADSCVEATCWHRLHTVLADSFPQHERMLEQHLLDTLLPFETNLRIFNRMHLLTCAERWRKWMARWGRMSRWHMDRQMLTAYHAESLAIMRLALTQREDPWLLRQDPSGAAALRQVRRGRRLLRSLSWRGLPSEWLAGSMAATYEPTLPSAATQISVA